MMRLFTRVSDDELRDAGWNPTGISEPDSDDGPYAAILTHDSACHRCGSKASAWSVISLETATGIGTEWQGDNAECEAEETAASLNAAWLKGRHTALRRDGTWRSRIKRIADIIIMAR